jgi:hypothetical protein
MLASLSFMLLYAHTLNPVPGDSIGAPLSRVVVSKSTNELLLELTSWRFPIKTKLIHFLADEAMLGCSPAKSSCNTLSHFLGESQSKDSFVFGHLRCTWMSTEYLSGLGFLFRLCHMLSVTHLTGFCFHIHSDIYPNSQVSHLLCPQPGYVQCSAVSTSSH